MRTTRPSLAATANRDICGLTTGAASRDLPAMSSPNTTTLRIALAVHGRGRGHASRCSRVIPAMEAAGLEVHTFAGGAALGVLANVSGLTEVETVLPGKAALRRTAALALRWSRRLRELQPDVLVSDGEAPSLVAAKMLGIPTVSVGHGLVFSSCRLPRLPAGQVLWEKLNAAPTTHLADVRVPVHFAPIVPKLPNTMVARPERFRAEDAVPGESRWLISYFRDGNGGDWLVELADLGWQIHAFGDGVPAHPGITAHPPSNDEFARLLKGARGVIGSAGSNLISECALLGLPMLALYRPDDAEQALNGLLMHDAGIGVATTVDGPRDEALAGFVQLIGEDQRARAQAFHAALPPVSRVVIDAVRRLAE